MGMKLRRIVWAAGAAFLLALLWAAPAGALTNVPVWNLAIHHNETNFPPGGKAEYWFVLDNVGDVESSGPVTLTVQLPPGVTRDYIRPNFPYPSVECPGTQGDTTVTCTFEQPIYARTWVPGLAIGVDIAADASGEPHLIATVEGGGGQPVTATEPTPIRDEAAPFGIVPKSFFADFLEADGLTPVRQAGAHPERATFAFDLNSLPSPDPAWPDAPFQKKAAGNLRHVTVELPPGFVGNPSAVGECTPEQLNAGNCPPSSQVGRVDLELYTLDESAEQTFNPYTAAVFNMTHPRGAVADLAFSILTNTVHLKASLDPTNHYAIKTTASDINELQPVFDQKLTLWGVPADPGHDRERCVFAGTLYQGNFACPLNGVRKPFLTVPTQCEEDVQMRLFGADSWQNTGVFAPELTYPNPGARYEGCDLLQFRPEVTLHPTGKAANTPTGLDVHLVVPQNENPNGLGTPATKSLKVTFPQGMTVSPSFADGLQGCSLPQIGLETNDPVSCPDASRIGAVTLATPLLPNPLEGSMYMANQNENPFGSNFAMYLVVQDTEERGILMKMPGRLDLDEQTGQITTSFDDLPQFPAEDLTLSFRSGPRAPLVSPPTCGKKTIGVEVASWAQPHNPVDVSNSYGVSEGPNGTACPLDQQNRPFRPSFEAGTIDPNAGGFSPFVFRLTRRDEDQELSRVSTTLPVGLTSRIADLTECPESALDSISSKEGTAKNELAQPACPASSQVGTMNVGMGSGSGPNYFPGKVYFAGPYKGAPLSLAFVVPALAGPLDLGTVVVRAAIEVDPGTTQIRVQSDRFPTILHGVLLRIRDVRVKVDRPQMMRNPTSCAEKKIEATISGVGADLENTADDVAASLDSRFQATNCASLAFKPRLSLRLKGGTHRGDYPALTATVRPREGNADIEKAVVTLSHSEFLAQEHIGTVCTRVQFAAKACPDGSIYGKARAVSPLLAEPLEGPVYLRSSDHPLPDLVVALHGKVDVNLVGRVDSRHGGIRTTFTNLPDVPVTSFVLQMKGGKKSLLVNSRNICKSIPRANSKMAGHNGRVALTHPPLVSSCKKKRGHHGK